MKRIEHKMKRFFQLLLFCFLSVQLCAQPCKFWPIFDLATRTAIIPFGNSVTFNHNNPINFRGLFPYDTINPSTWFTPDPGITTASPPNFTAHNLSDSGFFSIFPVMSGDGGTISFGHTTTTGFFLHIFQLLSRIEFDQSFTLISSDGDLTVGSSNGLANNVLDPVGGPGDSPDDGNVTIYFEPGISQINYALTALYSGDGFGMIFTFPDNCILKMMQDDTTVCAGSNLFLSVFFPGASILWSTGDTTSTINIRPTQTSSYNVAAIYGGVMFTDTIMITVNSSPSLFIRDSICEGENYQGYSVAGIYTDTLFAVNGCDSIRRIDLTVHPRSNSTVNLSICQGQNYQGYVSSGIYIDTLDAINGCDSVRTLHLLVIPGPLPDLGPEQSLCEGDSIILYPGQFNSYLWQDGSLKAGQTIKRAGLYSVFVTNNCGSARDEVLIKEAICDFYFPSAFTPNNDGKNDLFKALGTFNMNEYYLVVYNRWGQKVFETSDYTKGWDGKLNGQLQSNGVFIWYCDFIKAGSINRALMKGHLTLIR